MINKITTIQIQTDTRNLMKKIARKEQTYDDLIHELISLRETKDVPK